MKKEQTMVFVLAGVLLTIVGVLIYFYWTVFLPQPIMDDQAAPMPLVVRKISSPPAAAFAKLTNRSDFLRLKSWGDYDKSIDPRNLGGQSNLFNTSEKPSAKQ